MRHASRLTFVALLACTVGCWDLDRLEVLASDAAIDGGVRSDDGMSADDLPRSNDGASNDLRANVDADPSVDANPFVDANQPGDLGAPPPDLLVTSTTPPRYSHSGVRSPITSAVRDRILTIASANSGRNANTFLRANNIPIWGSINNTYLTCFSDDSDRQIDLGGRTALQTTIAAFQSTTIDSFARTSNADFLFLYELLEGTPSPLQKEIIDTNARFALVTYDFVSFDDYRRILAVLDALESTGVVPILAGGVPRDPNSSGLTDALADTIIRGIAEQRRIPYISRYRMGLSLPNQGAGTTSLGSVYLDSEGAPQPCVFSATGLAYASNAFNLASIETLAIVREITVNNTAAPDNTAGTPIVGSGTAQDPFVIDSLPFTHSFTTVGGQHAINSYPGCNATENESGPEVYYRFALPAGTSFKAVVTTGDDTDSDIHLLNGDTCITRGDWMIAATVPAANAGRLVIDTFVATVEKPGAYLLAAVPN